MRRSAWTLLVAAVAALSLGVAACGGGGGGGGGTGEKGTAKGAPVAGKTGGKLTVLWTDDVDFIDCGETYYQMGTFICQATQDTLYGYKPTDGVHMVPLLAESLPQVSSDGKTVTVKIKKGVKYSPPYQAHTVTSKDVKYAIERGFFNTVNNGYAGAYFGDLQGAKTAVKPGTKIPGITTPDDQTIVFHLTKPVGGVLAAGALGMPLTAPVPEAYAAKFDKKNPSAYGDNQLATGPYMIQNNSSGKTIGYQSGKDIHLVRNPSWNKSLDFRPAYLNEIDMPQGNDDTTVASRKILDGQSMINGDWNPPPSILRQAVTRQKSQIAFVPGGGGRWVSLNMAIPPFGPTNPKNAASVQQALNIRKAVLAGFDRNAMRLTRGGALVGDMATHFLPPGIAGFDQSGGLKGPGFDFLNATGQPNPQLSAEYFKKAGFSSGKYTGKYKDILMVGTAEGIAQKAAEVAKESFQRMGFNVTLRLVQQNTMYTKYCNVPSAKVNACPNVGWIKDFSDGQTLLDPTFNGKLILPQGNSNWSQLNDPKINAEMAKAETVSDPNQRAQAWAQIDKDITAQAPAVPWIWDKVADIASKNVNAVSSLYNATWDLSWTSLK
jgi:peptide/nickel transport system substrate-binding protein